MKNQKIDMTPKHEKMTKSEICTMIGDWEEIMKVGNFWPKSSEWGQTKKGTLLEAEKRCVTNAEWPIFTKIQKNHFFL